MLKGRNPRTGRSTFLRQVRVNFHPALRPQDPRALELERLHLAGERPTDGGLGRLLQELGELRARVETLAAPRPGAAATPPLDSSVLTTLLVEMVRGAKDQYQRGPADEIRHAIETGIKLGRMSAGVREEEASEKPAWLSVVEVLLSGLAGGLLGRGGAPGSTPSPPALPSGSGASGPEPAAAPPAPPPVAPVNGRALTNPLLGALQPLLGTLTARARGGWSAQRAAEWAADWLDGEDGALAGLETSAPQLASELVAAAPDLSPFHGWWTMFFQALRQSFEEAEADDEPDGGPAPSPRA